MTLRKMRILEIERGSSRLHCVENLLWKRLWTFRKTTEWVNHMVPLWYMCVIMKILLQIYLILDALHILHSNIQSVIVQMCLLYWTELTPFFTWVLQLSVCLSEYPCGVSVLTVPYFSVQLSKCWHQTLSHNANL
jgi:hypothetical protein